MWIPKFILEWLGHKAADKIGLQEGPMDGTKKWYQSTQIWNCVVIGVIGIYESLIVSGVHLPVIPAWIITILSALGIYKRVTATDKIG